MAYEAFCSGGKDGFLSYTNNTAGTKKTGQYSCVVYRQKSETNKRNCKKRKNTGKESVEKCFFCVKKKVKEKYVYIAIFLLTNSDK